MRAKLFLALFGLVLAVPALGHSRAWYDVRFGVTNAPGMVLFDRYPDVVLVPRTSVYVVDHPGAYEVYRYNDHWYACRGDRWYRASHYRSAFRPVSVRYVPRAVRYAPAHGGRHARFADYGRDRYRDDGYYRSHRSHRDGWDVSSGKHKWKHKQKHHDDD